MKIYHISDTHLRDFKAEPADILIHSGDALNSGEYLKELVEFRYQLEPIKDMYRHIIFTPGNHDFLFETDYQKSVDFLKATIPNLIVLHNESVVIDGVKFYGTSDQPIFFHWAFNKEPEQLIQSYKNIPDDVNVLITHCPPYGMLDYTVNRYNPGGVHVGSKELLEALQRLKKLKLHCFGHIHMSNGTKLIDGVTYSNASICDERYIPIQSGNLIDLS